MIGQSNRPGFHTVTPYLMVSDVDAVVEFLQQAFGATEEHRTTGAAGGTHVELRIGDTMVMIGGSTPRGIEGMPAALFLYVSAVDAVYRSALEAGATSLMEPGQYFGEPRGAGVQDPFGNQWFIATHA